MQAIVNTGAQYPAGSQTFTMSNPNYKTAVSTTGWTAQGTSNGAVSGVVNLVRSASLQLCVLCLSCCHRIADDHTAHPSALNGLLESGVNIYAVLKVSPDAAHAQP